MGRMKGTSRVLSQCPVVEEVLRVSGTDTIRYKRTSGVE